MINKPNDSHYDNSDLSVLDESDNDEFYDILDNNIARYEFYHKNPEEYKAFLTNYQEELVELCDNIKDFVLLGQIESIKKLVQNHVELQKESVNIHSIKEAIIAQQDLKAALVTLQEESSRNNKLNVKTSNAVENAISLMVGLNNLAQVHKDIRLNESALNSENNEYLKYLLGQNSYALQEIKASDEAQIQKLLKIRDLEKENEKGSSEKIKIIKLQIDSFKSIKTASNEIMKITQIAKESYERIAVINNVLEKLKGIIDDPINAVSKQRMLDAIEKERKTLAAIPELINNKNGTIIDGKNYIKRLNYEYLIKENSDLLFNDFISIQKEILNNRGEYDDIKQEIDAIGMLFVEFMMDIKNFSQINVNNIEELSVKNQKMEQKSENISILLRRVTDFLKSRNDENKAIQDNEKLIFDHITLEKDEYFKRKSQILEQKYDALAKRSGLIKEKLQLQIQQIQQEGKKNSSINRKIQAIDESIQEIDNLILTMNNGSFQGYNKENRTNEPNSYGEILGHTIGVSGITAAVGTSGYYSSINNLNLNTQEAMIATAATSLLALMLSCLVTYSISTRVKANKNDTILKQEGKNNDSVIKV